MISKAIQFKTYNQYSYSTDINGVTLRIHVRYNSYLNNYYADIDKQINGKFVNVIRSVMLYTGVDVLAQHPQLNLGKLYIIPMDKENYALDPNPDNIQDYIMLWEANS